MQTVTNAVTMSVTTMSCPQNSKQEGELGTEIVTVFVQETSKRILKYYHVDSILKRIGGGGNKKRKEINQKYNILILW